MSAVPATGGAGPVETGGSAGAITTGGLGGGTAGDNSGGSGADSCDPGLKKCGGICVPPTFGTGCTLDTCDRCPDPPSSSQGLCENGGCSFLCHDGYTIDASGAGCEPIVSGGTGGTGTGGAGTGGTATGGTGTGGAETGGTGTGGTATGGTGTGGTATGGTGTGGAETGGTGGSPPATGGTTGGCNEATCPGCSLGMSKCCSSSGNCGCAWLGVFPPECF
jgi:hypothetical protein